MVSNKLDLPPFIAWDHGENYPFSACMAKLMECLGGDSALYTYNFFAGISGDDFIMCYGNNRHYNDCVSVCDNAASFFSRTFGRIGLAYDYVPVARWKQDKEALKERIRCFIDRGIPVLAKGESAAPDYNQNYFLLYAYEDNGEHITLSGGDPSSAHSYELDKADCGFIFIDSLPVITHLAAVYRESVLQLPAIMQMQSETGTFFGAKAYENWARDLENGRYDAYKEESFDNWKDWCIYICNIATNSGHGRDFLAKAYVHNTDMQSILQLVCLLDRNHDLWQELEAKGAGFNVTLETLQDKEKRADIAQTIRKFIPLNQTIIELFTEN